jgi:hypothetical protein
LFNFEGYCGGLAANHALNLQSVIDRGHAFLELYIHHWAGDSNDFAFVHGYTHQAGR